MCVFKHYCILHTEYTVLVFIYVQYIYIINIHIEYIFVYLRISAYINSVLCLILLILYTYL